MNVKTVKIIGTVVIFLLCFPFHFLYDWFPNSVTAIFFPVNESIWEHMKLLFTSYIVYSLLEYIVLKTYKIKHHNVLLQAWLVPILGIVLYLLIYLPIYHLIGENMVVSIGLLFLVIVIEQIIGYYFLREKEIQYQKGIGMVGIIGMFVVFGYLTYYPPIEELFYDTVHHQYGIRTFIKE